MNRITRYSGGVATIPHSKIKDAAERLAAYEDTGLTPREIMDGKMLTGWIPVDERLPYEGVEVLATQRGNLGVYATTDEYNSEFGWESDCDVIAWMPLPEPYESKRKGDMMNI